ncbi:MAG TPA: peptide chain release factor N(5)-glutamine methyltransferase [Solirubrobacteraceae bacterium]|jgi:release factor glutamine methyltransferase|nr:peptide chain release factor N(5)-glutamine methyltransferase [Solirubrobacteraceae bacterium]
MSSPHVGSLKRGTPVRDALDGAVTAIAAAGCQTPRLDGELLLASALGVSRERLLIDSHLLVAGPSVRAFQNLVRRRSVDREPVAYILGRRHFRNLELAVDPRALIPRPETELLVEMALSLPSEARVLDLGTGSGAVALALKDERPDLQILASDISSDALELARENGRRLGLEVSWVSANLLEGISQEPEAILSNPPYIPDGDRAALAPEILRHEPSSALFAGTDGLDVVRPLIGQAAALPSVRLLALEVGAGQAPAVGELMRAAGFHKVRAERDLAGIERVVVGERA